jgi:hypothetical protein
MLLEPLLEELEKEAGGTSPVADGYLTAWERLRQAAIAARMDHLLTVSSR